MSAYIPLHGCNADQSIELFVGLFLCGDSIELSCEMSSVESQYAEKIAYIIGNKVVTASTLLLLFDQPY